MNLPQIVEVKGIRVLTTRQIAEAYEVKEIQIHQNFKNNRVRFVEGKHYISLTGDELKEVKKHLEKIEVVKIELHTCISGLKKELCSMRNPLTRTRHGRYMIIWLTSISELRKKNRRFQKRKK